MTFRISPGLENKAFLVRRGELEGRLDPGFHRPLFVDVDRLVKEKSSKNLGDMIVSMNGGSTPPKSDWDKHYAEAETGIPLLRVQNITEGGVSLDDVIHIKEDTHNNLLARSRVFGGDLLITITGRIASCAVAPLGFEGNINQHSVVIKTNNQETSEYLAAFLNSDVGQILAQKRATGGTRPALDYDALKSIPVIENLPIVAVMNAAHETKRQKEAEAQRLLDGIDEYLLGELGIELPEPRKDRSDLCFYARLSEVSGKRFDPHYLRNSYKELEASIICSPFDKKSLREVTSVIANGSTPANSDYSDIETPFPIIKSGSYDGDNILLDKTGFTKKKRSKRAMKGDVYILSAAHQAEYVGRSVKYLEDTPQGNTSFVGELICIRANQNVCDSAFLYSLLNTDLYKDLLNREKTGQTSHIYPKDIGNIHIPLPPIKKQVEIIAYIADIRSQAKQKRQQAQKALEKAKEKVKNIILG